VKTDLEEDMVVTEVEAEEGMTHGKGIEEEDTEILLM